MSAFIVCQEHISAMLQAAAPRYAGDGATYYYNREVRYFGGRAQEIGQILLDENYRSVNYRYSESESAPKFKLRFVRDCSPVQWIKLCDCYNYQSCETPDWEETEAHAIYEALRERAINRLPGYDEADWEFRPDAPPPPPPEPPEPKKHLDRDEATKRIRAALKRKTGKTWSVTGGRGTGWGWIRVRAPKARRVLHETVGDPNDPAFLNRPWRERIKEVPAEGQARDYAYTSQAECIELARAFGLKNEIENGVHHQGLSIKPEDWEWYVEQLEAA